MRDKPDWADKLVNYLCDPITGDWLPSEYVAAAFRMAKAGGMREAERIAVTLAEVAQKFKADNGTGPSVAFNNYEACAMQIAKEIRASADEIEKCG